MKYMDSSIKEKQNKINSIVRGIAYKVFPAKGSYKFVSAFDKLYAKVYLDHNIHINNRIKDSGSDDTTMFDVLTEDELKMVLRSCESLQKMYQDVIERKAS